MNKPHFLISPDWEELLGAVCDGQPTPAQIRRLEAILRESPEARRDYLMMMQLVAELEWGAVTAAGPGRVPLSTGAHAVASSGGARTRLSFPRLRNLHLTPLAVGVTACLAAAAFLLGGWLVGRQAISAEHGPVVAHISRLHAAHWSQKAWAPGDRVKAGSAVALESGSVEVLFANGARGVLRGPARLEIKSPGDCRLLEGRLHVSMPPDLGYFVVHTPQGKVIGVEARFGIAVLPPVTEVHVFKGLATIDSPVLPSREEEDADPGLPLSQVRLREGEAMRLGGQGEPRMLAADASGYVSAESLTANSSQVLLQEEFAGDALDAAKWRKHLPRFARLGIREGGVDLWNRAYLVTAAEYDPVALGGVRITGVWQFVNADRDRGNGGIDSLTVLTRCDPIEGPYYRQAAGGIGFYLFSSEFRPRIEAVGDERELTPARVEGELLLPVNKPIAFEVVDDGRLLSLTVWDPADPANRARATAEVISEGGAGRAEKNHVVVYNRERYSSDSPEHHSRLDAVTISAGAGPAWLYHSEDSP